MNNLVYLVNLDNSKKLLCNFDNIEYIAYPEKINYIKQKNLKNFKNTDEQINFDILSLLEKMGFLINKLGIYYYKDVIFKIIKQLYQIDEPLLEEYYNNVLKRNLVDPYSQFYFDLARNEYDIGIKTFHICIENSFNTLDQTKEAYQLLLEMINESEEEICYGQLAFKIAIYIKNTNDYNKNNNPKIKQKTNK